MGELAELAAPVIGCILTTGERRARASAGSLPSPRADRRPEKPTDADARAIDDRPMLNGHVPLQGRELLREEGPGQSRLTDVNAADGP